MDTQVEFLLQLLLDAFVAPDAVILRRIVLPATLPYIMAGIRLAVGRAVVGMVIAEFFTTISGLGAVIISSSVFPIFPRFCPYSRRSGESVQ